jgi:hypothetical protein
VAVWAQQARAKKDAKQLAAACLLESLLEEVPFNELLYKSEKKQQQRDVQVRTTTLLRPCPCNTNITSCQRAGICKSLPRR